MKLEIKQLIEEYVKGQFNEINSLDKSDPEYFNTRDKIVKEINIMVDLLQKEDVNESNFKCNVDKLKNEITKIEKDYDINLKKIECELKKHDEDLDLERNKVKNLYDIDSKKIENDIAKINNELKKIENDNELNNKKIKCDIDRINNEIKRTNIDKELNEAKLEVEIKKNDDNLHLENRKINIAEIKNNSDLQIKEQELRLGSKHDSELRIDRILKVCIDGATIMVPIIFYGQWMKKGFIFEETGTITSSTFKNLISKFKPTK